LKTGPARRVDPGLELDQVEEKIEEKNNPVWAGCNPLTFNFFLKSKWHRFDFFKKKLIRVTRSKPGTRVGFGNYGFNKPDPVQDLGSGFWPGRPG
jgi:hypothetical protein